MGIEKGDLRSVNFMLINFWNLDLRFENLPDNWVVTQISEIWFTTSGGTPSRSNKNYFSGNIPWLKSGELKNKPINNSEEFISEEAVQQSNTKIIPKGALLIALYGATVGRLGILNIDAAINQAICAIIPNPKVLTDYLFWFLFSTRKDLLDQRKGGAQPNISQSQISNLKFPLPPLPEQHRIVAKLEELFTKLDVSVAELKKAKAQIKRYRQSVLKYAFEGKLTEQWRIANGELRNETAEELLSKIKEERKKALGKKYKELPPVDATNLPHLPEGWVWTCLGEIITVSSGSGLTSAHMKSNGSYAVYGGNGVSGYYDKYMFEERKLIIGRVGAKCGVVHITDPFSWVTDNALIVEFNNLDMKFLFYLIHVLNLNQHSVSTAQPVISGAKIYPIINPLPPLKEQQQIVSEIERHFSVADETEKIIDQSLKQAERLRQSILKDAFSGKLVPQDPNDPPASLLLEKIKAEKEKLAKEPKTKKSNRRTGRKVVGEDKAEREK